MARDWRKFVDPIIREHLESQVKGTLSFKKAYESADNKGNAQLWVAVANLSKQIFNTSMKINYIEDLLKDVVSKLDDLKKQKEEVVQRQAPVRKPVKKTTKKKPVKRAVKRKPVKRKAARKRVARKTSKKRAGRKSNVRRTLKKF